jgi:cell wall-associated NlpC family hydrolase
MKHRGLQILLVLLAIIVVADRACSQDQDKAVPEGMKTLLERYAGDKETLAKLARLKEGGIEKELDASGTSPEEVIEEAKNYMGTPHCMGGTTKKCIDCSGLLMVVFAEFGVPLPHNSEGQARYGKIIADKGNLKPGDLVFFINTFKTSSIITHSGIYLGEGEFIHTSSSQGVEVNSLENSYWKEKYIFGTRVF